MLPADGHVHSQWSWDAVNGSMERTCAQAVAMGLPAVAFTEHADYTPWIVVTADLEADPDLAAFTSPAGVLVPPALDLNGYLECLGRCRERFSDLRIISGVELGEPHWHSAAAARLLRAGEFDRVLGSQHCLPLGAGFAEPPSLYRHGPADQVVRDYLAEVVRLIEGCDAFAVLAHIDYPLRYWPALATPFDPSEFEEEFRHALRVLAGTGKALEINTEGPMHPEIVRWWREEGGQAVTFGSDAHEPGRIGYRFGEASALAEASGLRPGRHPWDYWRRPQ
ncbi:PHP domain-containing protein [Trebonia sp.]|uniref:PHP domain-containing protein n=1 Tax=Trebonia sp. TaxID=2767075 RepID=UPI002604C9CD|nr:PHP domain-containing protein [Trebonia sp.]